MRMTLETPGSMVSSGGYLKHRTQHITPECDVGPGNMQANPEQEQ
jgi:hypothetical protein